jgi:hypothetical protein
MTWQLAQVNIARLIAAPDDPRVQEFFDGLEAVNALAEASPGFVWRLQSDDGDATGIRISDDERDIINLSVWTSVDALSGFVHRSDHVHYLRRRRDWFEPAAGAYQALWWVRSGHRPSETQALERIRRLEADGPSLQAFTFAKQFPPPEEPPVA